MTLIIALAYLLVMLVTARLIAGHMAWESKLSHADRPEGFDWFMGYVVGMFGGAIWPVTLVCILTTKIVPPIGAEARGELELERKQRKQLERELGIR